MPNNATCNHATRFLGTLSKMKKESQTAKYAKCHLDISGCCVLPGARNSELIDVVYLVSNVLDSPICQNSDTIDTI